MLEQETLFKDDQVEVRRNASGLRIEGRDADGRTRFILLVGEGRFISVALIDADSDCRTNIVWQEGTSGP